MDRRERFNDNIVAVRAMMDGRLANLNTTMPGIVVSYNAEAQTCVIQPAIQGQQLSPQGEWTNYTLKPCQDCPVIFPSGGGYTATFPIVPGDEGILVFGQRCIDAWWQSGGVQPQAELRMHDPSDGFFIPGARSQANKLTNVSTSAYQLRNNDGSVALEVGAAAIKLTAPKSTVSGPLGLGGQITNPDGTPYSQNFTTLGAISAAAIAASAGTIGGSSILTAAGGLNLAGGFTSTEANLGTPTNGSTIAPSPLTSLKQFVRNNVAGFTIAASGLVGDVELTILNGATPGTISFTGFDKQWAGDPLDTVAGHRFVAFLYGFGAGHGAYLIKALQ